MSLDNPERPSRPAALWGASIYTMAVALFSFLTSVRLGELTENRGGTNDDLAGVGGFLLIATVAVLCGIAVVFTGERIGLKILVASSLAAAGASLVIVILIGSKFPFNEPPSGTVRGYAVFSLVLHLSLLGVAASGSVREWLDRMERTRPKRVGLPDRVYPPPPDLTPSTDQPPPPGPSSPPGA